MADPYATLGVARGASEKDIKSAYRKLAKELHPDRNKDNPKAAERFSEVTRAYDLLSDKDKRARFDRGEIDAEGNPAMPFGMGGGGFGRGPQGGPGSQRGFSAQDFEGFGAAEADAYFHSRARVSQLGSAASDQSRPLDSRETYLARVEELAARYDEQEIPRPPHWTGFRLVPERMEFWIDRANRLHERRRFTREGEGWTSTLLYP